MTRLSYLMCVPGFLWCCTMAAAAGPTRVGDALVFEAEDWTTPREAWLVDRDTEDHWNLWTKNASAGWSGGVVLRSPTVGADRESPEAGAAPLHTHLEGIPAGNYEVVLNRTGRRLAVSLDGETWRPTIANSEDPLGVFRIEDGTFDLWIDDRYFTASNVGPGYYDYIRVEPFRPPALSHFQVFAPSRPADASGAPALPELCWLSDRPVPTGFLEIERDGAFEGTEVGCGGQPKLRNHRATFVPPDATKFRVRVSIPFDDGFTWSGDPVEIAMPAEAKASPPGPEVATELSPAAAIHPERPLLAGIPFAPARLAGADGLVVCDEAGPVPTQVDVTGRWPDGSVRWLFMRCLPRAAASKLRLTPGASVEAPQLDCEGDGLFKSSRISFDNGLLAWRWNGQEEAAPFALFDAVATRDGRAITGKAEMGNVRIIDGEGKAWGLGPAEQCAWEETGPVRAVLRVEGRFQSDGEDGPLAYKLRYFFTARSPLVQVQLTVLHDADGPEFYRVRSLAFRVPVAGEAVLRGQLAGADAAQVGQSGEQEIWQLYASRVRLVAGGKPELRQARSAGWAVVQRGENEIGVAVRDFWQTWPKSIALKPDGLHVRLLPDLGNDKYEARDLMDWVRHASGFDDDGCYRIRRAMAVRFDFCVRFGRTGDIERQGGGDVWAKSVLSPPYASAPPDRYCESLAFGPVRAAARDGHPEYEAMVDRDVKATLALREASGEYGWMNFGDWHGERTYNWGNNEYDLGWAMALQFARTGRWDFFQVGHDMARHYATIDTIHVETTGQMPGRVWAHCVGHVGVGEHRPASGPAAEELDKWFKSGDYNQHFYRGLVDAGGHIYQEGNFAYYFLTSDRDLLEAAELVCSAQAAYLTPRFDFTIERGAGWPLTNAVAAYESTGNPFYLNAARLYVERVVAKQDPVGGGWLLFQPPSECDGVPGVGGKAFATGILLYGLMRYDLVEPRADVKNCIVQADRWLVEQMWNEEKQGFRYKTGCDKYRDDANTTTTTAVCLPGLVYGYQLSGDERYLSVARKGLAKLITHGDGMGKHTGMVCRQSAFALPGLPPTTKPE